jgi:hypothetical protein
MKIELEFYSHLCETKVFEINGIYADYEDFGEKGDKSRHLAESHCCANMQFTGKSATSEVLNKYIINVDEYNEVVSKLEDGLSFGSCGYCN